MIKGKEVAFGQLEMWDGNKLIINHKNHIKKALIGTERSEWVFSTPSISKGVTYAFSNSSRV